MLESREEVRAIPLRGREKGAKRILVQAQKDDFYTYEALAKEMYDPL